MNIAREVIVDLLPLYAAGELSPQGRLLVETALVEDASLRRLAEALTKDNRGDEMETTRSLDELDRDLDTLLAGVDAQLSLPGAEAEKRSFAQARLRSGLHNLLLGAAIFATLCLFAFWFDGNSITMLKDAFPQLMPPLLVASAVLWGLVVGVEWLAAVLSGLFGRR
ncbi:MAG: hypothetical protein KIS80_00240 [Anaerolineales bacterium]|nr:hypothetical protein [Anaerolineales bacterium]